MRPIMGFLLAGGLMLGLLPAARGQSSPGEFGGYPPGGNTPQPSSGSGLSASYGTLPGGFPITSYYSSPSPLNQPTSFYGANYVLPQANPSSPTYFTPGTTSGQPTSNYGANYTLPLPGGQYPGIFTYGPTSGQPTSYYGANYNLQLPGGQLTYTRGPTNPALPGVNNYARSNAPTGFPGYTAGGVAPGPGRGVSGVGRAPVSVAPGGYFTPRLR